MKKEITPIEAQSIESKAAKKMAIAQENDANFETAKGVFVAVAEFANASQSIDSNKDGKKSTSEIVSFLLQNTGNGLTVANGVSSTTKWWSNKKTPFALKMKVVDSFAEKFQLSSMEATEAVENTVVALVNIERAIISIGKATNKAKLQSSEMVDLAF